MDRLRISMIKNGTFVITSVVVVVAGVI